MGFELDPDYKQVPERIADFKALHPDGCLRPVNEAEPYRIECIDGRYFIVYAAAAYRSPDDKLPGIGIAWEPFPGRTPYTTNSELQNAETSAWGRAIVAALRSESKAIASAEDVRNRRADQAAPPDPTQVRASADTLAEFHRVKDTLDDGQRQALKAWFEKNDVPPVDKASEAKVLEATAAAQVIQTLPGSAPDANDVLASDDIVGELKHLADQLGELQTLALDGWFEKQPEHPDGGYSRATILAAIEMARDLRSQTGPIEADDAPEAGAA